MRRIILIDGENLLYGLRKLTGSDGAKTPREAFLKFPFRRLMDEVLLDGKRAEILYYGAKLRVYTDDPRIEAKTMQAVADQAKFINSLSAQNIQFVKAGYLRARETDPCPNCQHHEWHLIEKGVDVGLAVRVVTEASKTTEIVLVTSDTDLIPAVRAAKQKGARIVHIGYEDRPILSLINMANAQRVISAPLAQKLLRESNFTNVDVHSNQVVSEE